MTAIGANVLTPSAWAAQPAHSAGFQVGIADPTQANTAFRQSMFIASMIAQFTADFGPDDVLDNGDLPTLEQQFEAALQSYLSAFFTRIVPQTAYFVDNAIGSDTLYDGTSPTIAAGTSHGPWGTIPHARNILSTYNLNGNTVSIQLGATGVYSMDNLPLFSPNSGMLQIIGNPSAQSTYTISSTPPTNGAVLFVRSGAVNLIGLTVQNIAGTAGTAGLKVQGATVNITDVSFSTTATGTLANANVGVGGQILQNSGVIFAGSANSAILAGNGGTYAQIANGSASGTPAYAQGFAVAQTGGIVTTSQPGLSWSGAATGPRYLSTVNSIINTNGGGSPNPNFYPGSSTGSKTDNSLYV